MALPSTSPDDASPPATAAATAPATPTATLQYKTASSSKTSQKDTKAIAQVPLFIPPPLTPLPQPKHVTIMNDVKDLHL